MTNNVDADIVWSNSLRQPNVLIADCRPRNISDAVAHVKAPWIVEPCLSGQNALAHHMNTQLKLAGYVFCAKLILADYGPPRLSEDDFGPLRGIVQNNESLV